MGNNSNVTMKSVKKENLIDTKNVTNKIKNSNNINFFFDLLMIFESITFKLLHTLEIKNLKVLQNINRNKRGNYKKNKEERIYSFYASKGGSWASITLISINFNDYTVDTKEIIRKHRSEERL